MSRPRSVAVAALAVGFAACAALVVAGAFNGLDEHALLDWMPGFRPSTSTGIDLRGLWRPFALDDPGWMKALDVWMYPASVLVSGLVVVSGFLLLRRRAALVWAAAWVAGNTIELLGKELLDRPRLHWHGQAIQSFQSSFPSGHTIRSILVASFLLFVLGRRGRPAVLWAAAVLPFLVVAHDHTPSDILGGICVGLALALVAREVARC